MIRPDPSPRFIATIRMTPGSHGFVGALRAPVEVVYGSWDQHLPTSWQPSEPPRWVCAACNRSGTHLVEWWAVHALRVDTMFCCSQTCADAVAAVCVVAQLGADE